MKNFIAGVLFAGILYASLAHAEDYFQPLQRIAASLEKIVSELDHIDEDLKKLPH